VSEDGKVGQDILLVLQLLTHCSDVNKDLGLKAKASIYQDQIFTGLLASFLPAR